MESKTCDYMLLVWFVLCAVHSTTTTTTTSTVTNTVTDGTITGSTLGGDMDNGTIDITAMMNNLDNSTSPMLLATITVGSNESQTTTAPCTCQNGGTCNNGTCDCPPDFNGTECQYPVACDPDFCNKNNTSNETCQVIPIIHHPYYRFQCACLTFYKGDSCDIYDYCRLVPCHNYGSCSLKPNNAGYTCNCVLGGDPDHDCKLNEKNECRFPPPVGGQFITCIDKIESSTLICSPGFGGQGCAYPVNKTDFCFAEGPDACVDEGYCKAHCNVEVCNGTSNCNFTVQAFNTSVNHTICASDFADGFYDGNCTSEENLFDGMDVVFGVDNPHGVLKDCSPYFHTLCTDSFGDGICDSRCQNQECLWDGWDCDSEWQVQELHGGVVIEYKDDVVPSIKNLTMISRANLQVSLNYTYPIPHMFVKANSSNFTSVMNLGRFLSGVIAKLPNLVNGVTDVYVCEPGKYSGVYGDKCTLSCGHCNPIGDICDWETAECLHGCITGYWGPVCDKNCPNDCIGGCSMQGKCTQCPNGFHGDNCTSACDMHCSNNECLISGQCVCQGNRVWSDDLRRCACKPSYFGDDCTKQCSNCHDMKCSDKTGECIGPCVAGFYGLLCDKQCPSTCSTCNQQTGTCSSADRNKGDENSGTETDNTGVIIGVVVSLLLVIIILAAACCYWRRRQSGDYIMDDEEGDGVAKAHTEHEIGNGTGASNMNPVSPYMGRSTDMIELDEKHATAVYVGPHTDVYTGREKDPLLSANEADTAKPKGEEPRQPADGDSEAEPEVHADGDKKNGGVFASSVVIEVDKRGRVMSITSADQVPSPSSLKLSQTDEDAPEASSSPLPDAEIADPFQESDTPPHSPLGDARAPLASEEDLLSNLGPRQVSVTETSEAPSENKTEDSVEEKQEEKRSRKSSTSSSSSSSSNDSNHSKHSNHSDKEPEPSTEM